MKIDIVATIGSASESVETLEKMIKSGLTIARLNMSHGSHDEHAQQIANIKKAEKKTGIKLKKLFDLSGPKIRVGMMEKGVMLKQGDKVIITTKPIVGNANRFSISYKHLARDVKRGSIILISDGKKRLQVLSTNGKDEIVCKVIFDGLLSSRRGVNLPGVHVNLPVITAKDKKDIQFAADHGADYVAVSFVREPKDVKQCQKILAGLKLKALIVSKIETREAMENLEEIVKVSDGVMIARGDLALEIGFEHVPSAQRKILALAKQYDKFVITATQVLDSMEKSPIPTRAEASDIAYAVWDGTDAIMLSGETAIGMYPVEAVEVISKIVKTL